MPLTNAVNPQSPCPCGSQRLLADCCLPFITRQQTAPTAEALMRSRYTAHVLLVIDYLWVTWDHQQRQYSTQDEIRKWAESCEWLRLEILSTSAGLSNDEEGIVTFIASYRQDGKTQQHHEISLFKKRDNRWLYVSHYDE